jgi:hypothetical protein
MRLPVQAERLGQFKFRDVDMVDVYTVEVNTVDCWSVDLWAAIDDSACP